MIFFLKIKLYQTPSIVRTPSTAGQTKHPNNGQKNAKKRIPGWKMHVRPKQIIMLQKLNSWKNSGGAVGCPLHLEYSDARRAYHKAVRLVIKEEKSMRLEATARSLNQARSSKEFWDRVTRSFPIKRGNPTEIDGAPANDKSIPNKFADMFSKEFCSYKPDSDKKRLHLLLDNDTSVNSKSECWTEVNIESAIRQLSMNKCTNDGFPPEVFSHCGPSITCHLSLFFRACESHGFIPSDLAEGLIHPVPKANKDAGKSCNYRPITIGCAVAKIFEACVLIKYEKQLKASSNQFGFKKGVGTAQCTMTVKGVAKHFIKNGSRVFATLLDASHAFDRANYHKIFLRLLLKGLPSSVIRLLLSWYENTRIHVMWRGSMSDTSFNTNHGVRQGGLLSPALFTAGLFDDLLNKLQLSGFGCRIGSKYYGSIAYADDIILLSPTIESMNKLLRICEIWANENNISFNPSKSQVICFAEKKRSWPDDTSIPVYLNGNLIKTFTEVTHLGHVLSRNLDDSNELIRIAKAFNRQFHAFFSRFNGLKDTELMKQLYNSYCTSFYGLECIHESDVSTASIRFFRKSVNIALMKLFWLPRESVSKFLIAEGVLNADSIWKFRSLMFWKPNLKSKNFIHQFLISKNAAQIIRLTHQIDELPISL